jgi:two-component system, OmpR family, phosphate regulon sensor histidine kinase PhoR
MKNPDPTQFKVQIGLMREQSDRIRALIDDLLTLARLESVPDLANDSIDIAALGQQILNEARSLSRGQHLLSLDMDTQGTLQGSRAEIYSACMNLVTNAIRYTPVGGEITLSWDQATSGGVQFSVRDTGVGIEAQHLPRLTERFYRVNRGRSRDSGGTGLGLAIAKRVLLRHQGRLKIESVHTKGSLFTAVFPAQRFTVAARSADATLAPAQPEK